MEVWSFIFTAGPILARPTAHAGNRVTVVWGLVGTWLSLLKGQRDGIPVLDNRAYCGMMVVGSLVPLSITDP